jgi:hypothetical protein
VLGIADLFMVIRPAYLHIPPFGEAKRHPIWIGPLPAFAGLLLLAAHLFVFVALSHSLPVTSPQRFESQ